MFASCKGWMPSLVLLAMESGKTTLRLSPVKLFVINSIISFLIALTCAWRASLRPVMFVEKSDTEHSQEELISCFDVVGSLDERLRLYTINLDLYVVNSMSWKLVRKFLLGTTSTINLNFQRKRCVSVSHKSASETSNILNLSPSDAIFVLCLVD